MDGDSSANNDRDSDKMSDLSMLKVLNDMFKKDVDYYNDPDPYEDKQDYDPTNPLQPDRRWRDRVETVHCIAQDQQEAEIWQEHLNTYEKIPPFSIDPEEYSRIKFQFWLNDQRQAENGLMIEELVEVYDEPIDFNNIFMNEALNEDWELPEDVDFINDEIDNDAAQGA